MRKFVLLAVLSAFLCSCATIPPRPKCKFEELNVEIYTAPLEDGLIYCMNTENMENLTLNYLGWRECWSDLELWAIQVEEKHGE
jgi:hypothetical protein